MTVCCTAEMPIVPGGASLPARSDVVLFEYAPILAAALQPYALVEVVLSTSWVKAIGYRRARNRLPLSELRARVVGSTFHSHFRDASAWHDIPRGTQIFRYVAGHSLVRWLAIDDRYDGFDSSVRDHLVLCDEKRGLGGPAAQQALREALAWQFGEHQPRLALTSEAVADSRMPLAFI
ncbi:hypothetical protein BH160DRAFT_1028 [Burkholderia sp. H160]|nr:hypothetical protein BH160DRAFT_1028 [Burkholderia sp. H160]